MYGRRKRSEEEQKTRRKKGAGCQMTKPYM